MERLDLPKDGRGLCWTNYFLQTMTKHTTCGMLSMQYMVWESYNMRFHGYSRINLPPLKVSTHLLSYITWSRSGLSVCSRGGIFVIGFLLWPDWRPACPHVYPKEPPSLGAVYCHYCACALSVFLLLWKFGQYCVAQEFTMVWWPIRSQILLHGGWSTGCYRSASELRKK